MSVLLCVHRCVGNPPSGEDRTTVKFHYEITHRQLTEIPTVIPPDSSLVSLSHNNLSQLRPSYLPILPVCKIMDFSDNRISVIHTASFVNIPNLENISLSKNALERVHLDMLLGLKRLVHLDLSSNKISSISRGKIDELFTTKYRVFNFPTTLLLHDNQLTTLDGSILPNNLKSPLILSMRDNPLICDERMCWMKMSERIGRIIWHSASPSCADSMEWETWSIAGNRSICKETNLREITFTKINSVQGSNNPTLHVNEIKIKTEIAY